MQMSLFDDEQILKAYTKDVERETAEKTERETTKKNARETAERMIKTGKLSLEEIAEYVPALSLDELKKMEADILQPA